MNAAGNEAMRAPGHAHCAALIAQVGIVFFDAGRTDAVGEGDIEPRGKVAFELYPVVVVVTDAFAVGADGA